MPEAQEIFQKKVADVVEAVMFENWLRFYFCVELEEGGRQELKIVLPDKSLEQIKTLYPELYPLAEKMNGNAIDFDASRNAVLNHIITEIEGKSLSKGEAQHILQSSTFRTKLNLFHTWVQLHEDQLDQGFAEFGVWRSLFARWLQTPGAMELARKFSPDNPGQ